MHLHRPFGPPGPRPIRRWPQLWALLLLAPAAFALTLMPVMIAAVTFTVAFGLPTLIWLAITADTARAFRAHLPAAIRVGACAGVTCLGLGGLFAFSVTLAGAALTAYAATAAWAAWSRRRPARGAAFSAAAEVQPGLHLVTSDEARVMTNAELCHAWRWSFVALSAARGVLQRAEVVGTRQVLLDEVEARHPDGLRAWLQSGAQASGGPDRFLDASGGDDGRREAA